MSSLATSTSDFLKYSSEFLQLFPRIKTIKAALWNHSGFTEALENYLRGRKFTRSKIQEYDIMEFS